MPIRLFPFILKEPYNQTEVWINGQKACFNPYGYIPFKIDIHPYCNAPGVPNTIAVKVVNEGLNSRWYAGSGIYRHVWLMKTDKVHLDEWDTFIDASKVEGKKATVDLHSILHNSGKEKVTAHLKIQIFSPQGKKFIPLLNQSIYPVKPISPFPLLLI